MELLTLPKEDKDDDFVLVGGPDSNKDRHSSATDKAPEGEGRRPKKGKKQKNAEKEAEKEAASKIKDLLTAADQSLYLAKAQGRNRVAIADEFARAAESSSRLVRGVTALKVPFRNR